MADVDADLWVLTETWATLAPGVGYRLVSCSSGAPDRKSPEGEVWTAIWSRWPGNPLAVTAEPDRTAAALIDVPGEGNVMIYGTVMPWLTDRRTAPITGGAAFIASLRRQAAEWVELRNSHPSAHLFVAGDFNQDLAANHYYGSATGRSELRSVLASSRLRCLTGDELDPLTGRGGQASIDHICVPVAVEGFSRTWPGLGQLDKRISDHYGVWANVKVPTQGSAGPPRLPCGGAVEANQ